MRVAHTFHLRLPYFIILTLFYLLATSQAIQSFSYKWTTIASHYQYSLDKTLKHETPKPYVYRAFMPYIVNFLVDAAPSGYPKQLIERSERTLQANIGNEVQLMSDKAVAAYAVTIILDFIFLFVTLWVLRAAGQMISSDVVSKMLADFSPVLFALMLVLSYRAHNGFIYDHLEILCLTLYVLFSMQRRLLLSVFPLLIAILNKETAVLFPLLGLSIYGATEGAKLKDMCLLFLKKPLKTYFDNTVARRGLIKFMLEMSVVASGYVFIHYIFREAPGGAVEVHGPDNVRFWLSAEPWISVTTPHLPLIPLPKPTNIVLLLPIVIVIFGFWKQKPNIIRLPLALSMAINIPLFLMFCYRDEFRNLSLVFPFAYLASLHTIICYYNDCHCGARNGGQLKQE